jgi:hypothetical protein
MEAASDNSSKHSFSNYLRSQPACPIISYRVETFFLLHPLILAVWALANAYCRFAGVIFQV